ncbi:MAG: cytochrome b/b6 domain-containing protein [Candidatus Eisenbacteria bacterium]
MANARAIAGLFLVAVLATSMNPIVTTVLGQSSEDCLLCHAQTGQAPQVEASALQKSVHKDVPCISCHWKAAELPHPQAVVRRKDVLEVCGGCHNEVADELLNSAHGEVLESAIADAPVCTDCHGDHLVLGSGDSSSLTYHSSVSRVCGTCHAKGDVVRRYGLTANVVSTYERSYHGRAARYGSIAVANCASCHGYHGILPSADPESSVGAANLAATCGKCHPGVKGGMAGGRVHSVPGDSRSGIVRVIVKLYVILICFVIGGMVLHNILDFARMAGSRALSRRVHEELAGFVAKLPTVVFVGSFALLTYTGFALRFPDASWTAPLRLADQPAEARALLHRIAAGFFVALCVYHVCFVLFSKRGRERVREVRPLVGDVKEFLALALYNAGLSKERPGLGKITYIDKSEYWATVWGSAIMIITGLFLLVENVTLKYFPLWFSELADAIHFYEALLATMALFIWHGYWFLFDPHERNVRTTSKVEQNVSAADDAS